MRTMVTIGGESPDGTQEALLLNPAIVYERAMNSA